MTLYPDTNVGIDLLHPVGGLELVGRVLLAVAAGAVIGWERERDNKPAGLRTFMLVSLGSALFVLAGIQTGMVTIDRADTLSRVMQGIVTGVGFLGAGEIIEKTRADTNRPRVQGLTSAAATWVTSALGIAAGCGLWFMTVFSTAIVFLILWGIKRIERRSTS